MYKLILFFKELFKLDKRPKCEVYYVNFKRRELVGVRSTTIKVA